jgi:hypothetical protein
MVLIFYFFQACDLMSLGAIDYLKNRIGESKGAIFNQECLRLG